MQQYILNQIKRPYLIYTSLCSKIFLHISTVGERSITPQKKKLKNILLNFNKTQIQIFNKIKFFIFNIHLYFNFLFLYIFFYFFFKSNTFAAHCMHSSYVSLPTLGFPLSDMGMQTIGNCFFFLLAFTLFFSLKRQILQEKGTKGFSIVAHYYNKQSR